MIVCPNCKKEGTGQDRFNVSIVSTDDVSLIARFLCIDCGEEWNTEFVRQDYTCGCC